MHNWSTFGARMNHGQFGHTRFTTSPNLGEATTFPLIISSAPLHRGHIQIAFCPGTQMGVPKLQQLGLPQLWGRITSCADLQLWRGLTQSFSPCRELSNGMLHVAFTQGNRVDFRLLVVGSQIANLTPGLSFGHNLCYKCPNEQCEPILDIYTSIAFQWYKELFKARSFDPFNHALKI
jgi:hypothetical protein